jgi:hypothetical protein
MTKIRKMCHRLCVMTKYLALVFLALSSQAIAASITCQPDPHETQLQILTDPKQVSIEVINPMGFSSMPLFDNASESSIPFIQMQSKDLQSLGDQFTFHWDQKDCQWSAKDAWIFECNGTATGSVSDVTALGLATSKTQETSLDGEQDTYKVLLTLSKNNTYFVSIPTATQFCVSAAEKPQAKRQ